MMEDNTESLPQENEKKCHKKKASYFKLFLQIVKTMRVEPFLFIFMFGESARRVSLQNLLEYKACRLYFQFPTEVCSNLSNYTLQEDDVMKIANTYSLITTLVATVPAIFLSVMIGPWSDKHGRKMPILFATFGIILELLGYLLCAIYIDSPLYYIILSAIPSGITSGMITILGSIFSMASENTSEGYRTLKFLTLEVSFVLGAPLGTEVGGQLYKSYGYVSVFAVSFGAVVISFLWALVFIKDVQKYEHQIKTKELVKDFFSFENIKDILRTCVKKRDNYVRSQIWLLIITMCCLLLGFLGPMSIGYFYVQKMYDWDVTKYSDISAIFSVLNTVLMIPLVTALTKFYNIKEPALGLLGSLSMMSGNIIKGLAIYQWLYYLSSVVTIPGLLGPISIRSRLSKLVPQDELGKVFAMLATIESVIPVLGNSMFSLLYNTTININPGISYVVASSFAILPIIVFVWCFRLDMRNTNGYEKMQNEKRQDVFCIQNE
ncbi:putative peptidoglycan muropeptide transporter SLC46 [Tachypleus tridentatus]|uniref:putative peptidoglycan muropeptide transporter SLC46 n=1 Tax=Tachypleus tridentatus TaxID=6853 RepID=UPI003FD130E8